MEEQPEQLDVTKLKYVLYARKSRIDEFKQVRSIPDQISECQQLAKILHLNIVATLRESQSAKLPHQRPIFNQMLKDIKSGKYDGILAWNPDRLARNMLEAGMLIDMIDTNIIKDLKFATHHFTKDANGKMLLGMAFVLSKQYSDKLSQDVTRGVRKRFGEGKTQIPKHGYINEEGIYKPDGKNHELIVEAWEMRKDGESLEKIAEYMNKNNYEKITKTSNKAIKITKQMLTDIFHDPFYYGLLVSKKTGNIIDLREVYDFIPTTTEEDYNEVQRLSRGRKLPLNVKRRFTFYPFKMMIKCAFCNGNMVVAPSTGHKKYLYARCDTKDCTRKKKSIRVKNILDFIYKFLDDGLDLSEKEYNQYYEHLDAITAITREKTRMAIHSREGSLKGIKAEIRERSLAIGSKSMSKIVREENEKRVAELEEEKNVLDQELVELKAQLRDPNADRLSLEQFLNLSKNAAMIVKSANPIIKDEICREIYLNFSVDEEKVASYQLKPPFDEMLKTRVIVPSRGKRT